MVLKILLGLCLISAVACSKKETDASEAPTVSTYVVKGDPHLVLAGAQMKPDSPYTAQNIMDLNDYSLTAIASFVEKEKTTSSDSVDLEQEEAPADGETPDTSFRLNVTQKDATSYSASLAGFGMDLLFVQDSSGKLQIKSLHADNETMNVNVLHWSQATDGNFISVLLDFTDPVAGKTIAGLYFRREGTQAVLPSLSTQYNYLAGPGVGISWDNHATLKLEVCGDASQLSAAASAMNNWKSALLGRLDIQVSQATQYGPFTELNQHCLYMVDTYISDPRTEVANFGVTLTILDRKRGRIADSDVMIFKAEFDKLRAPLTAAGATASQLQSTLQYYKNITFIHELGHFLGLDHQFDGTLSIMSYKFNTQVLTSYDVQAIQALYPMQVSTP